MKIKHSKYKNSGILFELLVRQITADTLEGKDSPIKGLLKKYFVKTELKLIDLTLRMFTEPVLELDLPSLEQHLEDVKDKKEKLMAAAESDRDTLMSNDKFAALLQSIGVIVPTKISLTTGKEAWASALLQ